MVRLQPDQLAVLDSWIAAQDIQPSRPEAIRMLLKKALPTPNSTAVTRQFGQRRGE